MKRPSILKPKIRIRRPRIRIRWKKQASWWVISVALVLFAFFFVTQLWVLRYTQQLLSETLSRQVSLVSQGRYAASFEEISIEYASRKLLIENFQLIPTAENGELPRSSYTLNIPAIALNGISLRKLYFDNSLEIEDFILVEPEVTLRLNYDVPRSKEAFSLDQKQLLPAKLEKLILEAISITEGKLNIHTQRDGQQSYITSQGLNLELGSFQLIDSVQSTFDISTAYLELRSMDGYLNDSLYHIKADVIYASAQDSSLLLEGFEMLPVKSIEEATALAKAPANLYSVKLPQVYAYGIPVRQLVRFDTLIGKELQLINPSLQLTNLTSPDKKQRENFKPEQLVSFLIQTFRYLTLEKLEIQQGDFSIQQGGADTRTKLATKINQIAFHQLKLDSLALFDKQKILYADSLSIQLGKTSLQLTDSLHIIQAMQVAINTASNSLRLEEVSLEPNQKQTTTTSQQFYSVKSKSLDFVGLDFLAAYHDNNLLIDSLKFETPRFYLTRLQQADSTARTKPEKSLYDLFSGYFYSLAIHKLQITDGVADVLVMVRDSPSLISSQIKELSLDDFLLDSTYTERFRPFYADNFTLKIVNYKQNLSDNIHRLGADEITISTKDDLLRLSNFTIVPRNFNFPYTQKPLQRVGALIDLQIPELQFQHFDILNSYLGKNLVAGEITIDRPEIRLGFLRNTDSDTTQIKVQALYEALAPYLENLTIDRLKLTNGNFQLAHWANNQATIFHSPETSVIIDNFRFNQEVASNPKRLFFADNLSVDFSDLKIFLRDKMHVALAGKLRLDTKKGELMAEALRIQPIQERYSDEELLATDSKAYLGLQIPMVKIQGVDFGRAYYQDILEIDSIYADQPFVELTHLPFKDKDPLADSNRVAKQREIDLKGSKIYASFSPYFRILRVNHALLFNGAFHSLRQQNNQTIENLTLDGITLNIQDFDVDPDKLDTGEEFLYAEDIKLNIRNYRFLFGDSLHVLRAKNMQLSTRSQSIEANDILLHAPITNMREAQIRLAGQSNLFYIKVPTLRLDNIDFDEVYQDEVLRIGLLELNTPEVRIQHYTNSAKRAQMAHAPKKSPYQLIEGTLRRLEVDKTLVFNAKGAYRDFNKKPAMQVDVADFDAEILNFKLDKTTDPTTANLFFAQDIQLNIRDFQRPLADSLHQIKIKKLTASTKSKNARAEGVQITPRNQENLIARMQAAGKKSLMDLSIPRVFINDLNFDDLQQDTLHVRHVDLRKPHLRFIKLNNAEQEQPEPPQNTVSAKVNQPIHGLLAIDSLSFVQGEFEMIGVQEQDSTSIGLGKLKGFVRNINFDSTSFTNDPRQLLTEEIQIQSTDYTRIFDDSLYLLHIDRFGISSTENMLWADSVRIHPVVSRDTFALKKQVATDQFNLRIGHIELGELDLIKLLGKPNLKADRLLVDGFDLEVYRDKRYPFDKSRRPAMLQNRFRQINFPFQLDSLILRGGYIRYAEQVKKARDEGFVVLEDFSAKGGRLSNDSVSGNQPFLMDMSFLFMGNSRFNAHFNIPMNSPLNRHRFYGTVDTLNMQDFNPILENTVFIRLKSGRADLVTFDVVIDQEEAHGEMVMAYNDLKVALLNKRTGTPQGLIKGIGTAFANMFVQSSSTKKTDNPQELKKEFKYERDEKRSMFNYWVKTLLEGFKTSIGI